MTAAVEVSASAAAGVERLPLPEHVSIAIIGTGFAGLGMAVALRSDGQRNFVLLERADDVGGTWRDNTYPGCACDVPSHLYSFSFALNPHWSRSFSGQQEIWEYLRDIAERYELRPHVRFGAELLAAAWDEGAEVWRLNTARGRLTADVLISGMGALSDPSIPELPGLSSFAGTLFHSASWDHSVDLAGRAVAVIGTGASSIQFVPEIAPRVGRLRLFQRTPPWIMPRQDRAVSRIERQLYRRVPVLQRLVRGLIYAYREIAVLGFSGRVRLLALMERQSRGHLAKQVPDPVLRAKLTPRYALGCKRILLSNDYYPALSRPNVEVITEGIEEVLPWGIRTTDGVVHEVDTIIFGTGFHVSDMAAATRVRGVDGLLDDVWQGSPQAYLGTTIPGFPNLFMLVGPNTGLGHNSMVYMIESQVRYVMEALRGMRARSIDIVDVRPAVASRYNDELQASMDGTVWTEGGCTSWYLDRNGRNSTLWPDFTFRFRRRTSRFALTDYLVRRRQREPTDSQRPDPPVQESALR